MFRKAYINNNWKNCIRDSRWY